MPFPDSGDPFAPGPSHVDSVSCFLFFFRIRYDKFPSVLRAHISLKKKMTTRKVISYIGDGCIFALEFKDFSEEGDG